MGYDEIVENWRLTGNKLTALDYDAGRTLDYSIWRIEELHWDQPQKSIEILSEGEVDGSLPEAWAENVECWGDEGTEAESVLGTVGIVWTVQAGEPVEMISKY